jgi:LuxR family transcriptional regulator, maltose regulon positive regulatory protein
LGGDLLKFGRPVPLAKIVVPDSSWVLRRERLFQLLETYRKTSIIWIVAPGGFGKTTLASSYLAERKIPCLWYSLDERDSEAAVFFRFMSVAARMALPGGKRPLPQPCVPRRGVDRVFALRYFASLYGCLRSPFFIVLDDYQRIPVRSELHECIDACLDILPEGVNVLILSRDHPPARFARLKANGRMVQMGVEEIRFTYEEVERMAQQRRLAGVSTDIIRHIHSRTRGWAAGLALIMDGSGKSLAGVQALSDTRMQDVFDYLAAEVFDERDGDTKRFLMRSAFLPRMRKEWVEKLTGIDHSGEMLSRLFRLHLFIERSGDDANPLYRYYPIFREFLLSKAIEVFNGEELVKTRRSAALLLANADRAEDALEILIEARDWDYLGRLVDKGARLSISQGRIVMMGKLLSAIPKEFIEEAPWLLYWLGVSGIAQGPAESRTRLERAFHLFTDSGDDAGILASWTGVVDTFFYERDDSRPLDHWIDWLDGRLSRNPSFPSAEIERAVVVSMTCALAWRKPTHPDIGAWIARAARLFQKGESLERGGATEADGSTLCSWINNADTFELLYDDSRRTASFRPSSPLALIMAASVEGWHDLLTADSYELVVHAITEGLTMADKTGVHVADIWLVAQGAFCALGAGDAHAIERYLRRIETFLEKGRSAEYMIYCNLACLNALLAGNVPDAVGFADKATKAAREAGIPMGEALGMVLVAQAAHEAGNHALASEQVAKAKDFFLRVGSKVLEFTCELVEAYFAIRRGQEGEGLKPLRKALKMGRQNGYIAVPYLWRPSVWTTLCVKALEAGIEVQYVQDLIRKKRLIPDGTQPQPENWPWPLKIRVLGGFELVREGKQVRFSGKAQKKPLQMLKMLAALGGNEVKGEKLSDWLWPESDGDRAHSSFTTTLSRLRRLIGFDKAIEVHDGKVSLNLRYCWLDVRVFEKIFSEIDPMLEGTRMKGKYRDRDREKVFQLAQLAVDIYKGPLLPNEEDEFWVAPLRERLNNRFLRLTVRYGRCLETMELWEKAADCYRSALEMEEPIDEELYQRFMVCQQHLDRPCRAVDVCRSYSGKPVTRRGRLPS